MNAGADPSIKNNLGQDALSFCSSLPELRGLLAKEQRKKERRHKYTKTQIAMQALGRRMTTATPIRHDMWLISMETLLMLYVVFEREIKPLSLHSINYYCITHSFISQENHSK